MSNYGQIPMPPAPPMPTLHGSVQAGNQIGGASFAQTMADMISSANKTMAEPEKLSVEAVTTGNVDIHEVMIALGKSEVSFKLITAVTQKVVGGFEKLTSMQI